MKSRGLLLPILLLGPAGCHHSNSGTLNTRDHVVSEYAKVLKSWDKDGDGELSRSEVQTMIDASFQMLAKSIPAGQRHPELETQRREMLGLYAGQDTNDDGYLTLGELLKQPLANFDCADADQDGSLSKAEVRRSFDRCPHVSLSQYAPKP